MMSGHKTQAGQSVLDQLGLDQGFIVKAKLAQRLARSIAEIGLSQREAAALLPVAQPKLSLITRGQLDDISQAKLEECLRALGHDIEISIGRRHEGTGEVRVREFA
jgi:predicted XRE-type DNA-binding protein